jgi:protein SCO1/2
MKLRSILWLGLGGLAGLAVILVGNVLFSGPYQYQGSLLDPPAQAAEISLVEANGTPFHLQDQKGIATLLFFGYTSCPDVCPTTLTDFKRIYASLGDQAGEVNFVFITVDPERDTPEIVEAYVDRFNPAFIGLSGSMEDLEPVWKGYFVYREIEVHEPGENYLVGHTGHVYAIDKGNNLRLTFPFGIGPEAITADIVQLLRE